jgi:hypothetical protein
MIDLRKVMVALLKIHTRPNYARRKRNVTSSHSALFLYAGYALSKQKSLRCPGASGFRTENTAGSMGRNFVG